MSAGAGIIGRSRVRGWQAVLWGTTALLAPACLSPVLAQVAPAAPNQPAASTPPIEQNAPRIPEINVEGQTPRGWSPVTGYIPEVSGTATRTDTRLIETPQSISVITRDQMDAQRAQTMRDALAYTPGIVSTRGFNTSDDSFSIRGFQGLAQLGSIYRDGLRYGANNFAQGLTEPYGLERIELLRGPASVLYGGAEPGGVLNLISKRPTLTPLHEIELSGGSYGNRQIAVDLGGPIDAAGVWSYRLTGLLRGGDTQIDHIHDDRRYIAPALTWRPNADTSLTLLGAYYSGDTVFNYGLPFQGTVLTNRNGQIPTDRFIGQPGFDRYVTETLSLGYAFEHRFNDTFTFRQNFRYLYANSDIRDLQFLTLSANQRSVTRSAENRRTTSTQYTVDNQLEARFDTGPLRHTLLVGLDYANTRLVDIRGVARPTVSSLDLFAPQYNTAFPAARLGSTTNLFSTVEQTGIYAQDQIRIADRLVLLVGGRYDWVSSVTLNRLTRNLSDPDDGAFTGRVGLVYLFDNGFAPYASYSTSFQTSAGLASRSGEDFKPTTGRQYEVGIRYQPPGRRSFVSLAAYELTKRNVTTSDPVFAGFFVQQGEVRSRGVELETQLAITDNFNIMAAYTYTDALVTKSNAADLGTVPATIPMHQMTLWGDYTFREGALRGFGFGAGVRYSSATYNTGNTARVPDYTVVDAMARYDFNEQWRLSVNVRNLFDNTYVASCTYACFYGERLTVTAALRYRF
ncbi:TonB-dependent siderophore receptor [Roseomonas hellenica]|uniref:TonB-dependent siderophore receptor n=1 Tax=Plastoroseomonas hellenica TaxID=2687306 RepID=A0ABS5F4V5_9PROT|nr:TonB-dependent siderophore receptor [Plastoroseomonas hellenica]MBR0667602.1 TonB-dependent siderophore receptor [Plastoroseomonas hellenica]